MCYFFQSWTESNHKWKQECNAAYDRNGYPMPCSCEGDVRFCTFKEERDEQASSMLQGYQDWIEEIHMNEELDAEEKANRDAHNQIKEERAI